MAGKRTARVLMERNGVTVYGVFRAGNPDDVLRQFWFATSPEGAYADRGVGTDSVFDVRRLTGALTGTEVFGADFGIEDALAIIARHLDAGGALPGVAVQPVRACG